MTEMRREVETAVSAIVARHRSAGVEFDAGLWGALEVAGFAELGTLDTSSDGAPLEAEAAAVRVCAASAALVPAADSMMVGRWLADIADIDVGTGAVVVARLRGSGIDQGRATVSGAARRVPWATAAATILLVVPDTEDLSVVRLDQGMGVSTSEPNLAGEPRGDVTVSSAPLASALLYRLSAEEVSQLRARTALGRAVALDAVIDAAVTLTLRFASERRQFGRPIASFQMVRHMLTQLVGERAATSAIVNAALAAQAGTGDPELLAVAARVRAGEAATRVARLAHQVHGAIGGTAEYELSQHTRRMWAWRDELGSQSSWEAELGRMVVERGGLWRALTSLGPDREPS